MYLVGKQKNYNKGTSIKMNGGGWVNWLWKLRVVTEKRGGVVGVNNQ